MPDAKRKRLSPDEALALALIRGDPGALREAESCALSDSMPLSAIARLLILSARRGREAMRQPPGRGRIAGAHEAALYGEGALHAQSTIRREACLPEPQRSRVSEGEGAHARGQGQEIDRIRS